MAFLAVAKGSPTVLFRAQTVPARSDRSADCRDANAVSLHILLTGQNVQAVLAFEGADADGGPSLPLPNPNAQVTLSTNQIIDMPVGAAFFYARLVSLQGTFANGQGVTITATPYVSPGQTSITAVAG